MEETIFSGPAKGTPVAKPNLWLNIFTKNLLKRAKSCHITPTYWISCATRYKREVLFAENYTESLDYRDEGRKERRSQGTANIPSSWWQHNRPTTYIIKAHCSPTPVSMCSVQCVLWFSDVRCYAIMFTSMTTHAVTSMRLTPWKWTSSCMAFDASSFVKAPRQTVIPTTGPTSLKWTRR